MIPIPSRNADETWFTGYLIGVLNNQQINAMHIRETETPGPTDLLVWQGSEILGWVELKVGATKIDVSQREFIRQRDIEAGNVYVMRLRKNERNVQCYLGLDDTPFQILYNLTEVNWKLWFWEQRRNATRYK